jgi:hypothetical protein
MEAVEGFLLVLARAVRQVHAYPVSSQICVDAVRAVCSHLAQMEGPDEICVSVTPDALLLHEQPLGDAVFVRQELARRLRRARVAEFTVQRDATARDLTRFCVNLIRAGESTDRTVSLASLMMEDGVEAVGVLVTARRELLQIAPTAPTQRDLVAHERRRRDDALAGGARTAHLFPPHRGWIRLDPAETLPVGVERFADGIENLDLVEPVEQDAIVSLVIPRAVEILRHAPFEVELEAAERAPGGW